MWMFVGFAVSVLAVAGVVFWYLIRRASGKVPEQRHHTYMALLVGIVVSGSMDDAMNAVAAVLLGGTSAGRVCRIPARFDY